MLSQLREVVAKFQYPCVEWAKLVIILVQNLNSFKEVTQIVNWFRFESDIISEHIHESDEKLMQIPESWGTRSAVVSCNRSKKSPCMSVSALRKKKIAVFPSSKFIRIYIFSAFGNLRIPTRDKCETELFNKWSTLCVSLMWSNFRSRQHQWFVYLVSFPYSSSLQSKMFPLVFTYIRTRSSV